MQTKRVSAILLAGLIGIWLTGCAQQATSEPAASPKPTEAVRMPQDSVQAQASAAPTPPTGKRLEIRVNCGAYEPFTDKHGRLWLADQELYSGRQWGADDGMTVERTYLQIEDTDIPQIYQYERYSMGSYVFNVPNGKYTVRLHFAETYEGITEPGMRIFSVSIQGQTVLKDLDLYQRCGPNKAFVQEYKAVEVKDGKLVIGFTPNIENPEINGIEVIAE